MQQVMLDPEHVESEHGLRMVPSPPAQRRGPRSYRWIARFIQIIFFANILVIAGLWANDGNIAAIHTEAALLTSVGRITRSLSRQPPLLSSCSML